MLLIRSALSKARLFKILSCRLVSTGTKQNTDIKENENPKSFLRIIVDTNNNYKFLIDSTRSQEDRIMNKDKFQIIIDKQSQEIIKSFKIDNYDDLFDDLKCLGNQIRIEYFYPLIMKEAENLAVYLEKNSIDLNKTSIQDLNQFKRIASLLKLIKYKYNCFISNENLYQIIKLLHSPTKPFVKLTDITRHFELININNQQLFDSCYQKLINSRTNIIKYDKNIDLNEVNNDWTELLNLINHLNIKHLSRFHIKKITTFIENLKSMGAYESGIKSNESLESEPILKALVLINRLTTGFEANNSLIYLNNLVFNLFEDKNSITKLFENHQLKLKQTQDYDEDLAKFKYKKETLQELEETLQDLEKQKKDVIPCKRRLIIELCTNYNRFQGNLLERLEQLENDIPRTELTPLMCQELMNFYSSIKLNINKATFYYQQLLITNSKNEFLVDRKRVLNFLKALYLNRTPLNEIIAILSEMKWKSFDQINLNLFKQHLLEFFIDYVYKQTSALDLISLTEMFFSTKFIDRNLTISKLILLKLIEEKNFKKATEYFKWNLEHNKLCVLELTIMRYYVNRLNNKTKRFSDQQEEIEIEFGNYLALLSKVFDWNHIYNLVFLAHVINGNFREASLTYESDLKKHIDLNVMKKIVNQYSENPILRRQIKYLSNIYKFQPVSNNSILKQEIQNVLNK